MSLLYAMLLAAVGVIVVAEAIAVVRRMSSPPRWSRPLGEQRPALVPIESIDRRHQALPYVGRDRRTAGAAQPQPERRRA